MLNAALLKFTGGRVDTLDDSAPPPEVFFNGGTPTGALGSLVLTSAVGSVFVSGLPYAGGKLSAINAPPARYIAGLGVDAAGTVCVSAAGAIDHYVAGLPLTADGRLCINAPTPPVNLSAFSSGFSDAEFY